MAILNYQKEAIYEVVFLLWDTEIKVVDNFFLKLLHVSYNFITNYKIKES